MDLRTLKLSRIQQIWACPDVELLLVLKQLLEGTDQQPAQRLSPASDQTASTTTGEVADLQRTLDEFFGN